MIHLQHRFIFVHVPRTGGTTIESILLQGGAIVGDQRDRRHATLEQYWARYPESREFPSFGMVRNPWDRVISLAQHNGMALDQYLELAMSSFHPANRISQRSWLEQCDDVGRFEHFGAEVRLFLDAVDLSRDVIPCLNASPKRVPRAEAFGPVTKKAVADLCAWEITRFGYTF